MEIYETQTGDIKPLDDFIKHYSSWYRLQKGVAWLIRFIDYLRGTSVPADAGTLGRDDVTGAGVGFVTVDELRNARKRLIRYVQDQAFPDEIASLKRTSSSQSPRRIVLSKSSKLAALSLFLADDSL